MDSLNSKREKENRFWQVFWFFFIKSDKILYSTFTKLLGIMEPQNVIKHRFFDLVATECLEYLKSKTSMNFKTALDVGCLYGHLVKKLSDSGIDCYGIEKDEYTKPFRITDKIEYREFDENTKLDKKFDLICLTQMIYYVKNPELVLKHSIDLLNPRGWLFISTQDPDSPYLKEYPQILESKMTKLLKLSEYEKLEDVKLIDCTKFRPDIYLDRLKNPTKSNELKNFLKYRFKIPYQKDPSGHHVFFLFQKLSDI